MASLTTFQAFVDDARSRVDQALQRWLPSAPDCPPLLAEAMRYSVMAGGKRLRPLLTLAVADCIGRRTGRDDSSLALPAACAVEFIHTYSLIHDDLPAMDDDALRRGRPTLHVVYNDAVAILAGDALQTEAFALLSREPQSADPQVLDRRLRTLHLLATAAGAGGMVGGQVVDIQAAAQVPGHQLTLDGESLRRMHSMKTGALIEAAAVAGAVMSGAEPAAVSAVSRWARDLGVAFQIVDDILDVEGSDADLGKTAGKDAARDKPTYPSLFGLERSRRMAETCAERAGAALRDEGLTSGWLEAMASWVLSRRS